MSISPGTRIGEYEILAPLGAGGMGEVYRARDTTLQREVALKFLPELLSGDPERLARFEREAQVLASLNHQNIAQIYGIEGSGPMRALVMECVDGQTVAGLIEQRRQAAPPSSLVVRESLEIARQIAEALEAAHDRGIIHRDLKPGNIMLRADGTVKVLDFGLAKALDPNGVAGSAQLTDSPTITSPALMTHAGVILGTAAYMAPEQARGRIVDRRADVWAIGAVLYELLAGKPAFAGETVTDVLAAVVTNEPDWSALPPETPAPIRRLLRRCLERDRKRRIADASEVRFQIEEALTGAAEASPAVSPPVGTAFKATRWWVPWTIAALLAVVAGALAWQVVRTPRPGVMRFTIEAPLRTTIDIDARPSIAVSPDGRMVVFTAQAGGIARLYVRRDDSFQATPLSGTEDASHPAFSPDGKWIAFFTRAALNKVAATGGPVVTLASIATDPRGLSWDLTDAITYTPDATGGVRQISSSGGTPTTITTPDAKKSERTHRWPQMLPGGKAVIFTVGTMSSPDSYETATIEAHVIATGERKLLLSGASMARYVPSGHLIFGRERVLYSVEFDPARLEVRGTPVPVVQGVAGDATTGAVHFACSSSGTLAYVPGSVAGTQHFLTWLELSGESQRLELPSGTYFDPRLSPDGRRLAVIVTAGGTGDVWVHDFERKTFTRLTFGGSHSTPVWSPDGRAIYYAAFGVDGQEMSIMRRPADGSRDAEVILTHKDRLYLQQFVSQDTVLVDMVTSQQQGDIGLLRLERDARPQHIVATPFDELASKLSPDGRWLAYQSNESGQMQIYVRSMQSGGRWQVSSEGGAEPHWAPDGKQLYYRADTQLMAAPILPGTSFQSGSPEALVNGVYGYRTESNLTYDIHPNGRRLLTMRLADESVSLTSIRVVLNWFREMRDMVKS